MLHWCNTCFSPIRRPTVSNTNDVTGLSCMYIQLSELRLYYRHYCVFCCIDALTTKAAYVYCVVVLMYLLYQYCRFVLSIYILYWYYRLVLSIFFFFFCYYSFFFFLFFLFIIIFFFYLYYRFVLSIYFVLVFILQARIKKIMQTDEEVGKIAAPVPVVICILYSLCSWAAAAQQL